MGTVRAVSLGNNTARGGATEDSFGGLSQIGGRRFIWNKYNRVKRFLGVIETTDSWTYDTSTWRSMNAAAGNKVEYVCGLSEDAVSAHTTLTVVGGAGLAGCPGVGVDITSANSAQVLAENNVGGDVGLTSFYRGGYPGIGYHFIGALEFRRAGTITLYGDGGAADGIKSGMLAEVKA